MADTDSNLRVFDEVADFYTDLTLKPAERRVLSLLGRRLHEMDMLDLGVGTGRTGYTFAPLVRRYVGLDQSPQMLARARELLGDDEQVELVQRDVRDLSSVGGPFDFVLFSFNGIDAVGHEDRPKILTGVRSLLNSGGLFLFSTHSTGALPLDTRRPPSEHFGSSHLYRLYASLAEIPYGIRIRRINRKLDLAAARKRGWAIVDSMSHNFSITDHYVEPEHQVRQLRDLGFSVEAIYDTAGAEVSLPFHGRDPWLDYLCRIAD